MGEFQIVCTEKDIDPTTYEGLIDCGVCYNVHPEPACTPSKQREENRKWGCDHDGEPCLA